LHDITFYLNALVNQYPGLIEFAFVNALFIARIFLLLSDCWSRVWCGYSPCTSL